MAGGAALTLEAARTRAAALDGADPLGRFRARFAFDPSGPLYVDGNSLGRLPLETVDRVKGVMTEWGSRLVGGWEHWIDLPAELGDLLAEHVLGARPGEVLVCDSVTVNLHKLAGAALTAELGAAGGPLVVAAEEFPTDRYVLEGLAQQHGRELRVVPRAELAQASRGAALTVASVVDYRSGEVLDLGALEGPVVWDLSHAAGAVELDLAARGAQLAVGCTYKYLNGGPGAPAFLYVRSDLQERLTPAIRGWFGQSEQFAMDRPYDPAPGVTRFLAGTPPIVALTAVRAGLDLVAEAGMPGIADKHRALTELFAELADAWLAPHGFAVASPRDPEHRGGHVALRHDEGWAVCRALIDRAGVVPDFRPPDVVRFSFPALYTTFADVVESARRVEAVVLRRLHRAVDAGARRVT